MEADNPVCLLVCAHGMRGLMWATGTVRFENVTVHYKGATGEPALKNLAFALESGQHLGIVGRTGSGKSTLAKVLFRIVVPTAGRVLLDDVDTGNPSLTRLRKSMAMVAQDPTLF
eukprot:6137911-Pyramimonas_sp.AAC.1